MAKTDFIKQIAPLVVKYAPKYDIRVCSPIIAQAILESAWGESKLAKVYHNYFGMKCGSKWTGPSVNLATSEEYTRGTYTNITANFRVYPDGMEQGVVGYFEFLQLERYHNLRGITDPREYLETIKADGYATSSTYVSDVMKVITTYDLTKYDPKEKTVTTFKSTTAAINVLQNIEKAEEGYLEKKDKTPKYLDDKTANAGTDNYTKYWRDINQWGLFSYGSGWAGGSAWYWCAAFQYWCFVQAFGKDAAKKLLLHAPFISCATLASKSKAAKRLYKAPRIGDVALFWKGTKFGHTGLVILVDKNTKNFWTIEGNTSGASGVIRNGGGVVVGKKYSYANSKHRFHRPDYAGVLGIKADAAETIIVDTNNATETNVAAGQRWLNKYYKSLITEACGKRVTVDGVYGAETRNACLAVWKDVMNRKYEFKLNPSNHNFLSSCIAAAPKAKVAADSAGTLTLITQLILAGRGYYKGSMDAACGAVTVKAINAFQKDEKLTITGVVDKYTWDHLFN